MWPVQSFWECKRRLVAALTLAFTLLGLLAPGAALAAPATSPALAPASHGYGSNCVNVHIVRRGQTLFSIARYYRVDPNELARVNGIRNWNIIYVGQRLCIPGGYTPPPPPPPKPRPPKPPPPPPPPPHCKYTTYTVWHGDTLAKIARRFGVDEWTLMRVNNLRDPNHIYVGQVLRIPSYCPPGPPPPPQPPAPPPPPEPPARQWTCSFFDNKYLTAPPTFSRNEYELNFNWGFGGPGLGVAEDYFSLDCIRTEYLYAGHYRFYATVDDGVRVYVDNTLVIDAWRIQAATNYYGDVYLNEGAHTIRVEYFEETGAAGLRVWWNRY